MRNKNDKNQNEPEFTEAEYFEMLNLNSGLSVCNQAQANANIPTFLQVKGNKWLSLEPLWDGLDLHSIPMGGGKFADLTYFDGPGVFNRHSRRLRDLPKIPIIVGHDNRCGAPGTDTLEHVRSVVKQCKEGGIPVYVKQLWVGPGKKTLAHHPSQFPEDLRSRDLPWSMPGHTEGAK